MIKAVLLAISVYFTIFYLENHLLYQVAEDSFLNVSSSFGEISLSLSEEIPVFDLNACAELLNRHFQSDFKDYDIRYHFVLRFDLEIALPIYSKIDVDFQAVILSTTKYQNHLSFILLKPDYA